MCDFCQKTVQELGVTRLDTCGRCKHAYYCGAECQKAAWKAGHRRACRPANCLQVGDIMYLYGLKNRVDLNGRLVRLVGPKRDGDNKTTTTTAEWKVSLYEERQPGDDATKLFVAKAKNLMHIRPEK